MRTDAAVVQKKGGGSRETEKNLSNLGQNVYYCLPTSDFFSCKCCRTKEKTGNPGSAGFGCFMVALVDAYFCSDGDG